MFFVDGLFGLSAGTGLDGIILIIIYGMREEEWQTTTHI